MPDVDLICLANSRKHGGRCVAGLRADGSGWVRPVGSAADGTLFLTDYMLSDFTEVGVLDGIRVGLAAPRPAPHQPENWVADGTTWKLIGRPVPRQFGPVLGAAVVAGPDLLGGTADRVPWGDFQKQPASASLALAAPAELFLYQQLSLRGRPQARGRFSLGPAVYDLVVTDPQWENAVLARGERTVRQANGPFVVTVSVGEPLGLFCYKLIAAVIPLPFPIT